MKATRKLTALLAVLGLLMTLWAPVAVAADTPATAAVTAPQKDLYFGRSVLAKMDNGKALCYAYDKLVAGIEQQAEVVDISHRTYEIDCDEAELITQFILADRADFYYTYYIGYSWQDDVVTTFYPYYDTETLPFILATAQRARELTKGLAGKSDFEKSLILHDRLCETVVYDANSAYNQNVISSLVYGASVCAGYARGYQMLLQEAGIPCFYIVGTADNGIGIGSHAWNLVRLDGQWYYTDVTWDDQNDNGGSIMYTFFNVTYDQIAEDHFAENLAEYLPHSTATDASYYANTGVTVHFDKKPDIKKIAKAAKKDYPLQLYFLGDPDLDDTGDDPHEQDFAFFIKMYEYISPYFGDIVYEMTGGYYPYSVSVSGAGRGLSVTLNIDHPHTFTTEKVAATCADKGSVTKRCKNCGYTTKEVTPAIGHTFGDLTADATHHGKSCTRCGLTLQHGKHTYEQDGIRCDTCGYRTKECNHAFDTATVYPTCTEDGQTIHTCLYCGETETETIPATGHQLCSVPGREPTCMQDGYTEWVYCSACGEDIVPREYLSPLDHDFSGVWQDEAFHGTMCIHCLNPGSLEEHVYDNDRDADCNICGLEREVVAVTPGDANGDGKINNRDLGLLQKYLNEDEVAVDPVACDVNGDGKVNNRDLGLFQRQLNE